MLLIHAVDFARLPYSASLTPETEEQSARMRLERFVADAGLPLRAKTLVAISHAEDLILAAAGNYDAGLIVIAPSSHTALARVLLGSVSKRVIRGAPCPVLVYRDKAAGTQVQKRAA